MISARRPAQRLHADPGLQPERTTLSWTRTSISLAVVSMILLRWARVYGPAVFPLVALLVVLALGIYFTQRSRHSSSVQGLLSESAGPAVGSVITLTTALWIFGIGGLLLVLSPH